MSKTNKKAAPVQPEATSKTNAAKNTPRRNYEQTQSEIDLEVEGYFQYLKEQETKRKLAQFAEQLPLPGMPMPPPERAEGSVADYLFARPGWHERGRVAAALGLTEREVRAQAHYSDGAVIFGSGKGQGLKHKSHADAWETRQCAGELESRANSQMRRRGEVLRAGGLAQ